MAILGNAPCNSPFHAIQHFNVHHGIGVGRFRQAKGEFANGWEAVTVLPALFCAVAVSVYMPGSPKEMLPPFALSVP